MHRVGFAEAHLALCRVHVHVDERGIDVDEEHVRGMAIVVEDIGVRLADRVRHDLVAHEAPVHEEELRVARSACEARRRDQSAQARSRAFGAHFHRLGGEIVAEDARGALARSLGGQLRGAPPVVRKRECDARARQRDARIRLVAAREFRRLALQELAPRGRIEIEVLDLDRGAAGQGRGLDRGHRARFARDAPRVAVFGAPAHDGKTRHRTDRSERLAAEAERGGALEIFQRRDLAGGETRHRERQVVALDARAVIQHPHAAHAPFRELHRHRLRARVEAVLHQLLQRRRGTVDHLARGDLIHEQLGERPDESHMR